MSLLLTEKYQNIYDNIKINFNSLDIGELQSVQLEEAFLQEFDAKHLEQPMLILNLLSYIQQKDIVKNNESFDYNIENLLIDIQFDKNKYYHIFNCDEDENHDFFHRKGSVGVYTNLKIVQLCIDKILYEFSNKQYSLNALPNIYETFKSFNNILDYLHDDGSIEILEILR